MSERKLKAENQIIQVEVKEKSKRQSFLDKFLPKEKIKTNKDVQI